MSDDDLIQAVYEKTRSFASINILRAAYDAGQASIQALEADAARYRWLRIEGACEAVCDDTWKDLKHAEALDAAIDAAMAAQEVKP